MRRGTAITAAAAFLAVALLSACGEPGPPDAAEMRQRVADASTRPGTGVVEARWEAAADAKRSGKSTPRLVIDRAGTAPGAPPRLLDDKRLAGRIELLDATGETLWSMGYRPAETPGEVVRLRAPRLDGAVTVRLREPGRGLSAQAPIGR